MKNRNFQQPNGFVIYQCNLVCPFHLKTNDNSDLQLHGVTAHWPLNFVNDEIATPHRKVHLISIVHIN